MKKIFLILMAAMAILFAGCKVVHEGCDFSAKELKVGFFVDDGSRGGGVFKVARLLYYATQLDVTMLDGKDIRDGNRRGCSLSDGLLVQASPCTVYDHAVQISSFIDQTPIFRETAFP